MFHFNKTAIFEPPLIYIPGLYQRIDYDVQTEMGTFLKFTELFASGEKISDDKLEEFTQYTYSVRNAFKQLSEFMNNFIAIRKDKINNKKLHKHKDMFFLYFYFLKLFYKKIFPRKV